MYYLQCLCDQPLIFEQVPKLKKINRANVLLVYLSTFYLLEQMETHSLSLPLSLCVHAHTCFGVYAWIFSRPLLPGLALRQIFLRNRRYVRLPPWFVTQRGMGRPASWMSVKGRKRQRCWRWDHPCSETPASPKQPMYISGNMFSSWWCQNINHQIRCIISISVQISLDIYLKHFIPLKIIKLNWTNQVKAVYWLRQTLPQN